MWHWHIYIYNYSTNYNDMNTVHSYPMLYENVLLPCLAELVQQVSACMYVLHTWLLMVFILHCQYLHIVVYFVWKKRLKRIAL